MDVLGWDSLEGFLKSRAPELGWEVFTVEIRELEHGARFGSPRGVVLSVQKPGEPKTRRATYGRHVSADGAFSDLWKWIEGGRA